MVDVRDAVDKPDDAPLERPGHRRASRVAQDPVAHVVAQVQPGAVALEHVHHPQRMLVVPKAADEALAEALIEHRLTEVPERSVAEVVPQPDGLGQVLVQRERPRHRPRDLRDLQRVRQPRAVVVALRGHEDLRLVLQPPERLRMHDPVSIAL